MSEFKGLGWYLHKRGDNPRWGYFLYYIRERDEFTRLVDGLRDGDSLSPMSWRGLVELIGCVPPPGANPEEHARHGLLITHNNRNTTISPTLLFSY